MKARASTRHGFGVTCFQGAVESPGHPLHTSSFLAKSKMCFCYRAFVVAQTLNSVPGDLESSRDLREQCSPGEPPSWSRADSGGPFLPRPPGRPRRLFPAPFVRVPRPCLFSYSSVFGPRLAETPPGEEKAPPGLSGLVFPLWRVPARSVLGGDAEGPAQCPGVPGRGCQSPWGDRDGAGVPIPGAPERTRANTYTVPLEGGSPPTL